MPSHDEYREDVRSNCEKCHDDFMARIDELEQENTKLQDRITDLEAQVH